MSDTDTTTTEAPPVAEVAEPVADAPVADEPTPEATEGEKSLGDAGKRALEAVRAERNKFRDEAKALREQFEALQARVDGREDEHAAEQARRSIEADALAKANDRIIRAEIRAAAGGKLNDPADALLYIDPADFEVGDDGEIDSAAVADAVARLIESKPYLAVRDGKRFQGDVDGGAREGSRPSQLSRADLAQMTAHQIEEARKAGRLNDLLGIRN